MKALIVGGPAANEWAEIPDGAQVWIDLRHAVTMTVHHVTWTVTGTDGVQVAYRLPLAVHPEFVQATAQQGPRAAQDAVISRAMTEFMATHGILVATTPPAVPSTPAPLFGVNGRPLGGGQ